MAYDVVQRAKELKTYSQDFILSPVQWAGCKVPGPVAWQPVVFDKTQRPLIPKERGLYAFVVKPAVAPIFDHGYLMYIGQTGHDSDQTLYDRFDQYFQDSLVRKRPKIAWMIEMWKKHLIFYFVPLPKTTDLKAMEADLNDALMPPCVTGDYSPEIRAAVKAF